jgi:hypothetical protein
LVIRDPPPLLAFVTLLLPTAKDCIIVIWLYGNQQKITVDKV